MAKKENQDKFLAAYAKCYGNVTEACRIARLDRSTFYSWKDDERFHAKMAAIEPVEALLDLAETHLVRRIKKGDAAAIIFTLKTRGKKRGYIERQELTGPEGGQLTQNVFVYLPDNGRGDATPGQAEPIEIKAGHGKPKTLKDA